MSIFFFIVGFQCNSGRSYYTAAVIFGGQQAWYIPDGNLANHTAYTVSGANGVHWRATLDGEMIMTRTCKEWRHQEVPGIDRRPCVFLLHA